MSEPILEMRGVSKSFFGIKALRAVARRQGWRRVRASEARIGDVGLVPVGRAVAVVVCVRRGEWVGRNEAGFSIVPSAAVRVAWTIA